MHISCQFLQTPEAPCDNNRISGNVMAEVRLILAFSGRHSFDQTRWTEHRVRHWVLDAILQGRQMQRIGLNES